MPIDDATYEPNETAVVTLADGPSYELGTSQSATVTLTSDDLGPVAPAAPTELTGKVYNGGRINLFWNDNSDNETSFVIEWSRDGRTWGTLDTVGADVATYTKTGLAKSTLYYFRVRAVNAFGASPWDNVLKIRSEVTGRRCRKRNCCRVNTACLLRRVRQPVKAGHSLRSGGRRRAGRRMSTSDSGARRSAWREAAASASRRGLALKAAHRPAPQSARRRQLLRRRCGPDVERAGR